MTRLFAPLSVLAFVVAGAASAATDADANGDGVLTIEEVQAVMPDVSAETFNAMDTNADGTLDADEVQAAQTAGLMPT